MQSDGESILKLVRAKILNDMNRAKDSTCIESFKKGQGLLKSISERRDTKKPHKNKQDSRKVVLA